MRCIMKENFAIMCQQDDLKCIVMAVQDNNACCVLIPCFRYCQINSTYHRIKVQEAIRNCFKNAFYQIEKILSVMNEYFR